MLKLDDYQVDAINRLKTGSILCGGVGSGKSRTALAYYFTKECNSKLSDSKPQDQKYLYIITTAKKRDSLEWEEECKPFGLDMDKVKVDSWNNIAKYIEVKDSFFIFDEQRVVGYGAWTKSFLKITKTNNWILLSATPGDTWTDYIPVFIANGFYKNKTEFINRHVVYSRYAKFPKVDHYVNCGRLIVLRQSILVKMDYSKFTNTHHKYVTTDYDKELYRTVVKTRWNVFENKPLRDASALCYLLRKIVNTSEDRVKVLKDLIKEHPRVIIFYNFDYELEILRRVGIELNVNVAEWNGHKHQQVPNSDNWIYLVQYTAGAEGWNCITTDTIIFYSQNYSYKIMVQSAGRIDRRNTPYSDLYYYHLKSMSSIDAAIYKALSKKKSFNERGFIHG